MHKPLKTLKNDTLSWEPLLLVKFFTKVYTERTKRLSSRFTSKYWTKYIHGYHFTAVTQVCSNSICLCGSHNGTSENQINRSRFSLALVPCLRHVLDCGLYLYKNVQINFSNKVHPTPHWSAIFREWSSPFAWFSLISISYPLKLRPRGWVVYQKWFRCVTSIFWK